MITALFVVAGIALGGGGESRASAAGPDRSQGDAVDTQVVEDNAPRFDPADARLITIDVPGYQSKPSALAAKRPTLLYLNRQGGIYTPANCGGSPEACNDSITNISSVPKNAVELPAWDVDEAEWTTVVDCVGEILSPFNVQITDQDPGSALHIESYIGGSPAALSLPGNIAGVSPARTDCGVIDDSITFVFPEVLGNDLRRTCETIAQEFAHSIGLDHLYLCEDPMSYLTDCGDKSFQFTEALCGEFSPRECRCGGDTQNSAKLLLDKLGRSAAPAIWLSEPMNGDIVAPEGFAVAATVTEPPIAIEIFIDGVLVTTETPNLSSGASYQEFDFRAATAMRPGTHHILVNARYPDSDHSVTALIKVAPSESSAQLVGGCSAASGSSGGGLGLLLLCLLSWLARRYGRSLARRALAGKALLLFAVIAMGCDTTLEGGTQYSNSCSLPPYAGVGQVGMLYSRSSGACTATLISSDTVLTAAHCTVTSDQEPLLALFRVDGIYTQYIATSVTTHPAHIPGAMQISSADLAIVRLNEEVPLDPMALYAGSPSAGDRMSLLGYDDWSPAVDQAPTLHSFDTQVAEADTESDIFRYDDGIDAECMQARDGGLVVGTAADGAQYLLGLQGHQDEIVRLDNYACWAACDPASHVPPALIPQECSCGSVSTELCGECGIQEDGGSCVPRADLNPCSQGLRCDESAMCVPAEPEPSCANDCIDASGNEVCEGDSGFRVCPVNPEGLQRCTCAADGQLDEDCVSGCLF